MIHPTFMDDFETFDAERKRVATPADVKAFQNKWFPKEGWPEWQTPDEWAEGDMVTVWVAEETGPYQRGDRLSVTPMEACGWESSCRGWCMEWGLQNLLADD